MPDKKVNFSDWFDPNNLEHIRAFKHLCKTSTWPEGFIPEHVDQGPLWHFEAVAALARCWVNHILPFDEGKEN